MGMAAVVGLVAAAWWYTAGPAASPLPSVQTPATPRPSFADVPLAFEPNQGQSDPQVLFQSRNADYSLFLTAGEAVIGLRGGGRPLRLAWQDANPQPAVGGQDRLPGRHHYLKGRDPAGWHRDIPTYGAVRYRDLYPGIDLVYYGRDRRLEYDLVVAPGADPRRIALALEGADAAALDENGGVQVRLGRQRLSLSKPVIYQDTAAGRQPVDGGYVLLADKRLGLRLAAYDKTRPLIIDPVLSYSTYLGGTGAEFGRGVAVDGSGNVFVVGQTASIDLSFTSGPPKASTDVDVLMAKFDSAGTLQAVTYLGGSGTDRGYGVAADGSAVYVVGDTTSTDFPTLAPAQFNKGGDVDAFVAKLDTSLSPAYVTYLGGTDAEEALGVAVDGAGNAHVAGATLSSAANGFPATLGAFNNGSTATCTNQATNQPITCSDAFVAKYDASGGLTYATYLGGSHEDTANAIAVTGAGDRVFVTGLAYSAMAGFSNAAFIGAPSDAYLVELDTTGTIVYGAYIGGTAFDQGQGVASDDSGNVYVVGITNSTDLPVKNALQSSYQGDGLDGFVAKLNPTASTELQYLTYLGGPAQNGTLLNNGQDQIFGIAVNAASGDTYVVGETMAADFPLKSPLQPTWLGGGKNGWGDAFVTKLDSVGHLMWSTYLGGGDDDWANAVALDSSGGLYVAGSSLSTDFPVSANAHQSSSRGGGDALLFKLDDTAQSADLDVGVSAVPDLVGTGEAIVYTVAVTNQSTVYNAGGVVLRATLPEGVSYQSATPAGACTASGTQVTCKLGTIAVENSVTTTITAVNDTAGDITFVAQVVRADQPDPDSSNNLARVSTKAALGSSGGGGLSPLDWMLLAAAALLRVRRHPALL